jgi:predicted esterase
MIALLLALALQDDVADVPCAERIAGKDPKKKFLLIGPTKDVEPPSKGYGLVLVLPGGDGGAAFQPFVKRIWKNAAAKDVLFAQLQAVEWTPGQFNLVVWPTESSRVTGMKFTTEAFARAIVEEVGTLHRIDPERTTVMGWSSGGPPAYAITMSKPRFTAGAVVAMSVFRELGLDLAAAKGQSYWLYHSKEDQICPLALAERAKASLEKAGARTELRLYDGGHGWKGPLFSDLKAGFEWLEKR